VTIKSGREALVVLGTGAHAKVVIEVLEAAGQYDILGVCSGDPAAPETVCGYENLGTFNILEKLRDQGVKFAAIGVGGWTDNSFREEVFNMAKAKGFELVRAIHPSAIIASNVVIGEGSMIGSGVTIMTEAIIGRNAIISSAALISHETIIADHVLISGAAKVGAQVHIDEGAVVAFSATVNSRVTVGSKALGASGAVAIKNVKPGTRVFGTPAVERS
jgi:sugar O-acyltransferase (sialic acid O-acetyltransferase NeuD family)